MVAEVAAEVAVVEAVVADAAAEVAVLLLLCVMHCCLSGLLYHAWTTTGVSHPIGVWQYSRDNS